MTSKHTTLAFCELTKGIDGCSALMCHERNSVAILLGILSAHLEGDAQVLQNVVDTISHLMGICHENIAAFIDSDVLPIFKALLMKHRDESVLQSVTNSFVFLAAHPIARQIMLDLDCLPALLKLCDAALDISVLRAVSQVLSELAKDESMRQYLLEAGTLTRLMMVCSESSDEIVVLHTSSVMRHMAEDASSVMAFRQNNVIDFLATTCELHRTASSHEEKALLADAIGTLANLVHFGDAIDLLLQGGVIQIVLQLPLKSFSNEIASPATEVLNVMSGHSICNAQLREAQAHVRLLPLCNCTNDIDVCVVGNCLGIIANMALDSSISQSLIELDILDTIVHLRELFSNVHVLRNCTKTIKVIAQQDEVKCATIVRHGEMMSTLIKCVEDEDDNIVVENVLAVFATASIQADHHIILLEAGVVACVLHLCNGTDEDIVLESAARTMEQLSACADTCPQLIDDGVPRTLLRLCNEEATEQCQLYVCATLANLAKCKSKRTDMVNQGVLQPLVALCSRSSLDAAVQHASDALRDLDQDDMSRSMLVQARYVESLVHMCKEDRNIDIVRNATDALSQLAQKVHRRPELLKAGVIRPLLRLCYTVSDLQVLVSATSVFQYLACDASCKPHLLAEPLVLQSFVKMCAIAQDREVMMSILGTLAQLAKDERSLPDIDQCGLLSPLVEMLRESDDVMIKGFASEVVANIATHESGREIAEEAKVIFVLISLCNDTEDARVLTNSTAALANLASNDAMATQMLSEDVVAVTLRLFVDVEECSVHRNACALLRNLSRESRFRRLMLKQGVVKPLMVACTVEDEKVKSHAAAVLANIALDQQGRIILLGSDFVSALHGMIISTSDPDCCEFVSRVVVLLSEHDSMDLSAEILSTDIISALSSCCKIHASPKLLANTGRVIRNIARSEVNLAKVIKDGAVSVLLRLCQEYAGAILGIACEGLALIAKVDSFKAHLINQGAVASLARVITNSSASTVLVLALQAMASLTRHASSVGEIMEHHVVELIVDKWIESRDSDTDILPCVIAVLINLTFYKSIRCKVVQAGGLKPMLAICRRNGVDSEMLVNVSKALHNVFREQANVPTILDEEDWIPVLVSVMEQSLQSESSANAEVTSLADTERAYKYELMQSMCAILALLVADSDVAVKVAKAGAAKHFVKISSEKASDTVLLQSATDALCSL
eukprot:g2591.t1